MDNQNYNTYDIVTKKDFVSVKQLHNNIFNVYIKQSSIISVINCWLFSVQLKIVHANPGQEQIQ